MEHLSFRRQFICSPSIPKWLSTWKTFEIAKNLSFACHPDLSTVHLKRGNDFCFFIGYVLDPYYPESTDEDIVHSCFDNARSHLQFLSNFDNKCGRYIVVFRIDNKLIAATDAGGLRQLFYTHDNTNRLCFGSQPSLLAKVLKKSLNVDILSDLQRTTLFKKTSDYWFPGIATPYTDIYHVLPNHYLDLNTGTATRYWPYKYLPNISQSECIAIVAPLLSGALQAANTRYKLLMGISSGLDSRILLAASRNFATSIQYFTLSNKTDSFDVTIPSKLLKTLNLSHHVLPLNFDIAESFKSIGMQNVYGARYSKLVNAYTIKEFLNSKDKHLVVFGNLAEIAKRDRYRWPITPRWLLSGNLLSIMSLMWPSPTAQQQLKIWLKSVRNVHKYNIQILDLMHWEQRVGNWAATTLSEYDIAFDSLCPYNCRKFFETMLKVPFKYRTKPQYALHKKLLENLWPAVLKLPVSPQPCIFKNVILDLMYSTKTYDLAKIVFLLTMRRSSLSSCYNSN